MSRFSLVLALILAGCFNKSSDPPVLDQAPDKPLVDAAADKGKPVDAVRVDSQGPKQAGKLHAVKLWGYQIQRLFAPGAVDALVASKYDMLVVDPTRSDRNHSDFDSKGMVAKLHATSGKSGNKRIVIAYIDIGEAESWRYYWGDWWTEPTATAKGNPDFLISLDPDGWANNYPVAYWDGRWKNIVIHAADSMLNQIIDDGYDGVYLDWVEGFLDAKVRDAAKAAGVDPAVEMVKFIRQMRDHARKRNPEFLVIQQNAAELADGRPYAIDVIDAIAQEQIWYDGLADKVWTDTAGCDVAVPATGANYSQEHYLKHLAIYKTYNVPIFNAEYACDAAKVADAYSKAAAEGFIPYVSRRALDRLTDTPPPGY